MVLLVTLQWLECFSWLLPLHLLSGTIGLQLKWYVDIHADDTMPHGSSRNPAHKSVYVERADVALVALMRN